MVHVVVLKTINQCQGSCFLAPVFIFHLGENTELLVPAKGEGDRVRERERDGEMGRVGEGEA